MADTGIKVVKSGADIGTTDIREILMSSKYPMLKYHSDSTTSVTLSPGDTDKYTEITHDLGYVPAFIAYVKYQGKQYFIPSIPRSGGFTEYAYAWASSSVIRVGYAFTVGYNKLRLPTTQLQDYWDDHFGASGYIIVGNKFSSGISGAIRFPSVTINKNETITAATLDVAAGSRNAGDGDIKVSVWGIDEDNTADFGGNPMGRTKTTAKTDRQGPPPNQGEYFGIDVKSQVQEITTRSGWASGNAIGFIYNDNGSASNAYIEDDYATTIDSKLSISYGSSTTAEFRVIIFKDKIA